jgi:hypothetical protein
MAEGKTPTYSPPIVDAEPVAKTARDALTAVTIDMPFVSSEILKFVAVTFSVASCVRDIFILVTLRQDLFLQIYTVPTSGMRRSELTESVNAVM